MKCFIGVELFDICGRNFRKYLQRLKYRKLIRFLENILLLYPVKIANGHYFAKYRLIIVHLLK